ncbi:MAG: hypothetical protein WAZ14_00380 [Patescibacteria group bacterium]
MVVNSGATTLRLSDTKARLAVEKNIARRGRDFEQPRSNNLVTPELPQTPPPPTGLDRTETFQRADRQRRVQNQIGQSAGMDLVRRTPASETQEPIDKIQADYAQKEASLLARNQAGQDKRSAPAKRSERNQIKSKGLNEAMEELQKKAQKEIQSFFSNSTGAVAEVVGTPGEDGGFFELASMAQNSGQAVRTILSPAPPEAKDATSIAALKSQFQESILDGIIPRFNLHTMSGIEGMLKAIAQMFFVGLVMLVISIVVLIQISIFDTIYQLGTNPFKLIFNLGLSKLGM